MKASLNPFNPGSGLRPPALVGRDSEMQALRDLVERNQHGLLGRGMILSGLRGVGKTVLLNEMRETAEQSGWFVVSLEARPDAAGSKSVRQTLGREFATQGRQLLSRSAISKKAKHALGSISSFNLKLGATGIDLGVGLNQGRADSGTLEVDLPELVADISGAMREDGRAIGIFVDELQDLDPELLRALLVTQHQAGQRGWPFYIIGAGLPHLPGVLADSRSYAERLFDYRTIAQLPIDATELALTEPLLQRKVSIQDDALHKLAVASDGYPYFIQELGRAAWDVAPSSNITSADAVSAITLGLERLDQGFFRSRWERATPAERRMLIAMSADTEAPSKSSDIARRMDITTSSLGPYRARLIHKGLIYSPDHGQVAYTVPGMREFIVRHQDDDTFE